MDEFDVPRGREVDEIRDALVRQGYKASAAPCMRWNVSTKEVDPVPIYGPKALAFRGTIEDALQSRGFLIPTATPVGESAYSLVVRNLFPQLGGIVVRTALWGQRAIVEFPPERVQSIAESPEFQEKVKAAVRELGANRDSELATVALLTAEIAGIDVLGELRAAATQREASAADSTEDAITDLAEVVSALAAAAPQPLPEGSRVVCLKQSAVLKELNRQRLGVERRAIGSQKFARYRREIGVRDSWLRSVHKAAFWDLPLEYVESLRASPGPSVGAVVGPPPPPGPRPPQGDAGGRGGLGDPSKPLSGPPPLPSLGDTDDLFGDLPTKTDRLRSGAR